MPSLVSHKLSIIKYVVLKKIIFYFLCFDRLIWTWTWLGLEPLWTRSWLGLEPLWTWSWLGLEPLWTWTCLGLDKGGLDYSPTYLSLVPAVSATSCSVVHNQAKHTGPPAFPTDDELFSCTRTPSVATRKHRNPRIQTKRLPLSSSVANQPSSRILLSPPPSRSPPT